VKRHKSLHALSQHHHFALIQALFIRRAQKEPAAKRAAALRRAAEKFLRFWEKAGKVHFREEEEVLLPAYARHTRLDEDAEVMRMLADHAEIRAHVARLGELLAAGAPVEAEIVVLGRRLNDHVRLEENTIFPRIERALGEGELSAIGRTLTRLHRRGEVCDL
jgi:hemerythrin-like domain-containing protein